MKVLQVNCVYNKGSTAIFEGVVRRVIKEYKNGTEG